MKLFLKICFQKFLFPSTQVNLLIDFTMSNKNMLEYNPLPYHHLLFIVTSLLTTFMLQYFDITPYTIKLHITRHDFNTTKNGTITLDHSTIDCLYM